MRSKATAIKEGLQQMKAMFQWSDGPVVKAMRQGSFVVLDEISLADDSVLERLNSVLGTLLAHVNIVCDWLVQFSIGYDGTSLNRKSLILFA